MFNKHTKSVQFKCQIDKKCFCRPKLTIGTSVGKMDPLVKPPCKIVWQYVFMFDVRIPLDPVIPLFGISLLELSRLVHRPGCSLALLILIVNGNQLSVHQLGLMKHFTVHPFREVSCSHYKWLR